MNQRASPYHKRETVLSGRWAVKSWWCSEKAYHIIFSYSADPLFSKNSKWKQIYNTWNALNRSSVVLFGLTLQFLLSELGYVHIFPDVKYVPGIHYWIFHIIMKVLLSFRSELLKMICSKGSCFISDSILNSSISFFAKINLSKVFLLPQFKFSHLFLIYNVYC